MNYRHAYHAGNLADVVKHVVLARILAHLLRKPAPFRVVDTHAGIGLYDLGGEAAEKTREWQGGVGRMDAPFPEAIEEVLAPWRGALARTRARYGALAYPGSPLIAAQMLRPDDRAVAVEKHPEDHATLAATLRPWSNVKALHLDGWTALGSLLPPPERRGVVLIDPPFEEAGEFERCAQALVRAERRWPTGIYALWYPLKRRADAEGLAERLAGDLSTPTLRLELETAPLDGTRLAGTGLVVLNPPWRLSEEAELLLPALAERLSASGRIRCEMLVAERTLPPARRGAS